MKYFLILLIACIGSTHINSQNLSLEQSVTKLNEALIAKDTITLRKLLNDKVSYGHSNAWLENKSDMIKDLFTGVISYTKIETTNLRWIMGDNWASVRSKTKLGYIMDNEAGQITLHVLQVWIKTMEGWQLIARQGTIIP